MSAITETEQFDASIIGPDAGSPRTAASVRTMGGGSANRARWMNARLTELLGSFLAITAVVTATDSLTVTGHGMSANDPVRVYAPSGLGVLPAGLAASTVYYAIIVDANTIKLSASSGGAAVDITSVGSGVFYAIKVADGAAALYSSAGSLRSEIARIQALLGAPGGATTRVLNSAPYIDANNTSKWALAAHGHCAQQAASAVLEVPITAAEVPHGAVLSSFSVTVSPTGHGALPAVMSAITLVRTSKATGSTTLIGGASDTSANAGALDTVHAIQSGVIGQVIDHSQYWYAVQLTMESGANSTTTNSYYGADVTFVS